MRKISLLLLLPAFAHTQETQRNYWEFGVGVESNFTQGVNLEGQWQHINPNLTETPGDSNLIIGIPILSTNGLNLSLQFKKQSAYPRLSFSPRVSYSFGQGMHASQSWIATVFTHTDTLTSSQTGSQIYLDSAAVETKKYSYNSRLHLFKIGTLLDFRLVKGLYLYGGFEFGIGMSSKNRISVNYSSYAETERLITAEDTTESVVIPTMGYFESSEESYRTSSYISTQLSALLGVKVRPFTEGKILNKILVSYEFGLQKNTFFIRGINPQRQIQYCHLVKLSYEL